MERPRKMKLWLAWGRPRTRLMEDVTVVRPADSVWRRCGHKTLRKTSNGIRCGAAGCGGRASPGEISVTRAKAQKVFDSSAK